MHLAVSQKIILGLIAIVCIGTLSMLLIYRGLNTLQKAMREFADVKEPTSAAAYEMEINVNGMGLAVLKYLDTRDPLYRAWVDDDEGDFEHFHAMYLRLIGPSEGKELGHKIGGIYHEFKTLGHTLMEKRDAQSVVFAIATQNIEKIDTIIDEALQPKVNRQAPDGLQKIEAIADMEADIAEMGIWLANYQRVQKVEYKQLMFAHEQEFHDALAQFKSLSLSEQETHWGTEVEKLFTQLASALREVLALEDLLQTQVKKFIDLRLAMDLLLDREIQILALHELSAPRREANRETGYVLQMMRVLIPLFILSAVGVGFLLIRDASEMKLQETIDDLRREITERERAEEEQARLQVSLRHSEIMAAMGSLVAGVAHEVRNPLFAISSTLDALEARFGTREEYRRYFEVLRREGERLSALMQALLEYGRPVSQELAAEAIDAVITQAVRSCAPLAKNVRVEIGYDEPQRDVPVRMNRQRLLQVFHNLIENALQHSPPGSTVRVEAVEVYQDGQPWIDCMVKDSGVGFRPDDLPKIFDPFFTRRRGGTGLGLSIVQRIVEEHGGKICADNRPEGGAVVSVRFPLAPWANASLRDPLSQEAMA